MKIRNSSMQNRTHYDTETKEKVLLQQHPSFSNLKTNPRKELFNFNMNTAKKERNPDLRPGYFESDEIAAYLRMSPRKLPIFRKYRMLKYVKLGRSFVYRKEWADEFMEKYAGFDLSNEAAIEQAAAIRAWEAEHAAS